MSTLFPAGSGTTEPAMSALAASAAAEQQARQARKAEQEAARAAVERQRWIAIALALTTMVVVVGTSTCLVLGLRWLGPALGGCVAAITLGAWYTVSGRTVGTDSDVRERVLERHYVGVAWYASMLRNSRERGGYERGLRRELTRLTAARLAERHGVNLYRNPHAAARLVGADLWPLVDPALLDQPGQPGRPGGKRADVPIRAVAELIERLERM